MPQSNFSATLPCGDRVRNYHNLLARSTNLHFTNSAFTRNQFGLWNEKDDLLTDCRDLSGITFMNPDDAAAFIIGELWKRLRKTHQLRVVK